VIQRKRVFVRESFQRKAGFGGGFQAGGGVGFGE
jgi:hypothetical protein